MARQTPPPSRPAMFVVLFLCVFETRLRLGCEARCEVFQDGIANRSRSETVFDSHPIPNAFIDSFRSKTANCFHN